MKYQLEKRKQQFIKKAHKIHHDRYNYQIDSYINSSTPMIIICSIHGQFTQRPRVHLEGGNCPQCVLNQSRLGNDEIIRKSNIIHHNKYNYKIKNNITTKQDMLIECSEHGWFHQRISRHLAGHGCKLCAFNHRKLSVNKFIEMATNTHGPIYDYSKVNYINIHTKVLVICTKHDVFEVTPALHVQRTGCPKCRTSKLHNLTRFWLQTNNIQFIEEYRFDTCRDKYPLPFDFFCPQYNLLIECDGQHHFYPVSFGSTKCSAEDQFKITQRHDNIKTKAAKDAGLILVRIPYWEYSSIDEILLKHLGGA